MRTVDQTNRNRKPWTHCLWSSKPNVKQAASVVLAAMHK